jgi:Zn-dependent protease
MAEILIIIVIFISITFHEVAHGYVAYLFGDTTAKYRGRLSLNPLKHIDLFGTIILPLLLFFSGMPVIGWAKPVPINPNNFPDPKKQMMWTALAGPLTNFTLALLLSFIRKVVPLPTIIQFVLINAILINLVLGTFNLIPIPPLDGSRVVSNFLSGSLAYKYSRIEPYGLVVLFVLIYFGFFRLLLNLLMPLFKLFLI